jgi:hypothetical protein
MVVKKDELSREKSSAGKSEAHARRMKEFRARAEKISLELSGRRHSDSAVLIAEDRVR